MHVYIQWVAKVFVALVFLVFLENIEPILTKLTPNDLLILCLVTFVPASCRSF